jgi:hypothetical protein
MRYSSFVDSPIRRRKFAVCYLPSAIRPAYDANPSAVSGSTFNE